MTDQALDAEIQQITNQIKAGQTQLVELMKRKAWQYDNSAAKALATTLHSRLCRWNHTDGCGWYYRENDWTDHRHQQYLAVADRLLVIAPADVIMPIISALEDCR